MKYDLIIVACSKSIELKHITQNCIDSALADKADVNVIIVETSGRIVPYNRANDYVSYTGEFFYNKALNLGIRRAKGDMFILANNDIIFMKGWSQIGPQMKINGYQSACALSESRDQKKFLRGDWIYEGYEIGSYITGWCIFLMREGYSEIGMLDETFEFWYSDNIYAEQLKAMGIKHGLFCNVQVNHITSQTLKTITPRLQRRYSCGVSYKFSAMKKLLRHA